MKNVTITRDRDGREIALVRLGRRKASNGGPMTAKLDKDDYERLRADGWSARWYANTARGNSYVTVTDGEHKGSGVGVARLITEAGRDIIVQYRDGDRLNLRQDNLVTTGGYAPGKTPVATAKGPRKETAKMAEISESAYDE